MLEDAHAVRQLGATFDAAVEFGLDEKEIWAIIIEVCNRASFDAGLGGPLEELSAALACKILEQERSTHS